MAANTAITRRPIRTSLCQRLYSSVESAFVGPSQHSLVRVSIRWSESAFVGPSQHSLVRVSIRWSESAFVGPSQHSWVRVSIRWSESAFVGRVSPRAGRHTGHPYHVDHAV